MGLIDVTNETPEDVKTRNRILNNLNNNYNHFDYDAEKDALFQAQRRQLERNQRSGVSDVLAQYAANTGMGGSSAAMSAAQQTASNYNAMISDALGTAENRAYNRWLQERSDLLTQLGYAQNEIDKREAEEAAAAAAQEEIGMNGITKSQYNEQMQRLLDLYKASTDDDERAGYVSRMDELERGYYGTYTPAELAGVAAISDTKATELVNKAAANNGYLTEEEYKQLAAHFERLGMGGEAVLHQYGIKIDKQSESALDSNDKKVYVNDDGTYNFAQQDKAGSIFRADEQVNRDWIEETMAKASTYKPRFNKYTVPFTGLGS